jgi:hypothetical protein
MDGAFDAIRNLIDVEHLESVRLTVVGGGRVGYPFLQMALHHGIKHICLIEPDTVSARNFASGFPEDAVGNPKAAFIESDLRHRRMDLNIGVNPLTLATTDLSSFIECVNWSTHVAFFIDSFDVVAELVRLVHPARPCIYAGVLDGGRVGEAAWSIPGQTPCLNCTARLPEKQGASGGETLLVDVVSTVILAFRQFLGLCLIGRRGFELFQPFVDPRRCLAYVVNAPGSFVEMLDPGTPCGVRLVEVVDEHGVGPACSTCQGYRP